MALNWEALPWAGGTATLLVSIDLWSSHRQLPYSSVFRKSTEEKTKERGKEVIPQAFLFWGLIALLDSSIAWFAAHHIDRLKVFQNPLSTASVEWVSGPIGWIVAGAFGSLITRARFGSFVVQGKKEAIGITLVYDLIRLPCEKELRRRLYEMKRTRDQQIKNDLLKRLKEKPTITPQKVKDEAYEFIKGLDFDSADVLKAWSKLDEALEEPADQQMTALVVFLVGQGWVEPIEILLATAD